MIGSRSSKRLCTLKNNREVLSDINEKRQECVELSDSHSSESSCESSSPIVKRHRKTKRKVLDPSKVESSENVEVYSSLAKKSFEKIHSAQFNFSVFSVDANAEDQEEEVAENPDTGDTDLPVTAASLSSHEESTSQSSPSPPTPPPPLRITNARKLRSRRELSRKMSEIRRNIRKFDQISDSSQIPIEKTTTRASRKKAVAITGDDSVIIVEDDDDDDDDCCICEEGSEDHNGGGGGGGGSKNSNRGGRLERIHSSILDSRRIVVMVKVELEVKRFEMNYNDTFCQLFADLARDLQVTEDCLILLLNDTTIHQNESPASIRLRASDILVCLVSVDTDWSENMADRTGPNVVHLVIQSNGQKRCNVNMSVGKFETFQGVLDIYRKQQNLNSQPLKLYFDGELLDTALTPAAYGIEDDDCLDLVVQT